MSYTPRTVNFHKIKHKEILEFADSKDNFSDYVRKLIQRDKEGDFIPSLSTPSKLELSRKEKPKELVEVYTAVQPQTVLEQRQPTKVAPSVTNFL
jgi:hypothetical protein